MNSKLIAGLGGLGMLADLPDLLRAASVYADAILAGPGEYRVFQRKQHGYGGEGELSMKTTNPLKIFLAVFACLVAGRYWAAMLWWIFDRLPQGETGYWVFAIGFAALITIVLTLILKATEGKK